MQHILEDMAQEKEKIELQLNEAICRCNAYTCICKINHSCTCKARVIVMFYPPT